MPPSQAAAGVFASSQVVDLTDDGATQLTTPPNSQTPREDKWAFGSPVEPNEDFITRLPPETLD